MKIQIPAFLTALSVIDPSSCPTTDGMDETALDKLLAEAIKSVKNDPDNPKGYQKLGEIYMLKEDCPLAIKNFTKSIEKNEALVELHTQQGNRYFKAEQINKEFAEAYCHRGKAYMKQGDYAHARIDWEKTLELEPNNAEARDNLKILRDKGH